MAALVLTTTLAYAQKETPKFEVGAQISLNRLRDLDETDPGVGVRVAYNFTRNLAAEGEFNYFGRDLRDAVSGHLDSAGRPAIYSRNRTQALVGVKYIFFRNDKVGIGAKLRPGVMRFNGASGGTPTLCGSFPGIPVCQLAAGSTKFATDFGGVVEFYTSKRTVVRFDFGDTIIRFGPAQGNDGFTSNNLQLSVGVGFRF
jgi:hypothetical protein